MGVLRLFIRRPVFTTVTILLAVVIGIYSYLSLGVALIPKVDIPIVVVSTIYEGAGPTEIESLVSKPIEDAVAQVEGIKQIKSYSVEGASFVVAEFKYDVNISQAVLDVSNRVKAIASQLPEDAKEPVTEKVDINAEPFMTIAVTSSLPPELAYDVVEDKIQRRLTQLRGLAKADILGGRKREINVYIDPAKLAHFGVTLSEVISTLSVNNFNDPSGHIAKGDRELTVRVIGQVDDAAQIGEIRLYRKDGVSIRISDFARVVDATEEERGYATYQGRKAIFVECIASPNSNIVSLSAEIRKELDKIKEFLPEGFTVIITNDDSNFIKESIWNVFTNMGQGILLCGLVLFLFLQNISVTLVVAITMPTAVIATFILMYAYNITMNMMSTLGLAISIGVLVNNAILVFENVFRYREMGYGPVEAAEKGTAEIAISVLSTTSTNLGVFIPVAFTQGIAGQFLRDFALTVVFSTIFSLWTALTFTPMMAARTPYGPPGRVTRFLTGWWIWLYSGFEDLHHVLVTKSVRHPWLTFVLFGAMFVGAVSLWPRLGVEFTPRVDEGVVKIDMELPTTASLAYTRRITSQVEAFAKDLPGVQTVEVLVGGNRTNSGVNRSRVRLFMTKEKDRPSTFDIADMLRPYLAGIPDLTTTVAAAESGGGPGKPIEVSIIGDDIETLNTIALKMLALVRETKGAVDADVDWRLGRTELRVEPNRWRLGQLGLTVDDVAVATRGYITGKKAGVFRSGGKEYDILARLEPAKVETVFQVPDLPLPARDVYVPLKSVADMTYGLGPTRILRTDRMRSVTVQADVSGRSVGEVFAEIQKKLKEVTVPRGYRIKYGGEVEDMRENFLYLGIAFVMAIILTFLMIAAIIESYFYALIIMLTVPLAVIGVIPLQFITNTNTSIYGILGFIMLVGMVVNNALVILDYAEMTRKEGKDPTEAILEACTVRLRPIIMADLTSAIAMVPLALGLGAGGAYRAPMAIVSIGGIVAGGSLALFVIPPVYSLIWRFRGWRAGRKRSHLSEA